MLFKLSNVHFQGVFLELDKLGIHILPVCVNRSPHLSHVQHEVIWVSRVKLLVAVSWKVRQWCCCGKLHNHHQIFAFIFSLKFIFLGILLVLKMDLGKRVEYVMGSFLLSMLTSIKVPAPEQLWLLKSGVRALPQIPCLWVNLSSVLLLNQTLALFYASAAFSVHWHIFSLWSHTVFQLSGVVIRIQSDLFSWNSIVTAEWHLQAEGIIEFRSRSLLWQNIS